MKNKILMGTLAGFSLVLALTVFAQTAQTTISGTSAATVSAKAACVGKAVGARESALASGISTYATALSNAYSARASSLQTAYAGSPTQLKTAIKTSWTNFNSAVKTASKNWKTAKNNAWTAFTVSAKACKAPATVATDAENNVSEVSGQ